MIKILPEELKIFFHYIHSLTGIFLDDSKGYLVESRIGPLLEEFKCSSYSDLYFKAKSDPKKVIQRKIVDAIATGETSFFRDAYPFELLQHKILPDLIDKKTLLHGKNARIPIRIWSSACSTGQEVYSIAMILKELLGNLNRYEVKLVGTDISDYAISRASRGIYSPLEIGRGLTEQRLLKYFCKQGDQWRINDEIRSLAVFKNLNLLTDMNLLGRFDIILCRNVAIYFTEQDRTSLFNRISMNLESYGYLIIGSTESIVKVCPQFESKRYLRSIFYQLIQPPNPEQIKIAM